MHVHQQFKVTLGYTEFKARLDYKTPSQKSENKIIFWVHTFPGDIKHDTTGSITLSLRKIKINWLSVFSETRKYAGMLAHTFTLSTREAGTSNPSLRLAWAYRETLP